MLAGIGSEPPKDRGGSVLLEFDGGTEAGELVPVLTDQGVVDGVIRVDLLGFSCPLLRYKDVEVLHADADDARREGEALQLGSFPTKIRKPPQDPGTFVQMDQIYGRWSCDHPDCCRVPSITNIESPADSSDLP